MNVSGIYELYKTDTDNTKKVSEGTGRVPAKGIVNVAGTAFDNEFIIKNTQSTSDAYDRIRNDDLESGLLGKGTHGDRALSVDMLNKLGEIVNEDNFDMYEELGIAPDKDDPTSILTVSERIEIELATHCEDYQPTGDISLKDIEAVYGNTGRTYQIASEFALRGAQPDKKDIQDIESALDKVDSIRSTGISNDAAEYLLANHKQITIDNVYTAIHSVTSGRGAGDAEANRNLYGTSEDSQVSDNHFGASAGNGAVGVYEKISDADWQGLISQAEDMIENTGLEVNEETLADARFLVETKIPLTGENLYKLSQIRDINSRQLDNSDIDEKAWISKLSSDITFLGNAGASSMDYYSTVEGDSIEAVEILNNGTEDQVASLVMDGRDVTILNMKRVQDERSRDNAEERKEQDNKDLDLESRKKVIEAKRTLEEARLRLTVGSGAFLIKNGFNINIMALSDTVEKLKQVEAGIAAEVFKNVGYEATSSEMALYSETTLYMREFAATPAYVLGEVYSQKTAYDVTAMTEAGRSESMARALASETYDVLGTKPDRELGDSINKAFEDIPNMLKELGLENSTMNSRAVRILAYNELEINQESIAGIKEMDTEVSRLIDNLTPKTTAYLIANGVNPLNTNISELNDALDEINRQIGRDEVEKYSEYLFRLDKNKSISREDREAYIGIYRVLNMIEKSDRKAIGALVKQGGELTMSNMLALTRSLKKSAMDISVDDELGMTESVTLGENNIDSQLSLLSSSAFYKRAKDNISPELLKAVIGDEGKALSEAASENIVSAASTNTSANKNRAENLSDASVDEFLRYMSDKSFDATVSQEYDDSYYSMVSHEIENIKYVSEDVIKNIMEDQTAANMSNILGMSYIMQGGRRLYDTIVSITDDDEVRADIESIEDLMSVEEADAVGASTDIAVDNISITNGMNDINNVNNINDTDELENRIQEMSRHVKETLLDKSSISVQDIRGINGAINYIRQAAKNQVYYVPVEYGDERTLIKLTLKNDEGIKGRLDVRIFGDAEINVTIKANPESDGINITIKETEGISREVAESIAWDIKANINEGSGYQETAEVDQPMLLGIAKEFISRVSKLY